MEGLGRWVLGLSYPVRWAQRKLRRKGLVMMDEFDDFDRYGGDDDGEDRSMFADPGGNSALRAATPSNPRNLPCPSCLEPDRLTPADKLAGYQCNQCADADEGIGCC